MDDTTHSPTRTATTDPLAGDIKGWKDRHGKVFELKFEDENGDVLRFIFKPPSRAELNMVAGKAMKKNAKAIDMMEELVFGDRLYPSEADLTAIFKDRPGLAVAIGQKLFEEVGFSADFTVVRH